MEGHSHWSCAPGTRALRRASLDGRSRKHLIPLLGLGDEMGEGSLEAKIRSSPVPFLLAERARSECARSMRAVKGSLGRSLEEKLEEVEGPRSTAAVKNSSHPCLVGH